MASCTIYMLLPFFFILFFRASATTDPGDVAILRAFEKGLKNPSLLKWPADSSDPCGTKWPNVYCSGNRVSQIQVQNFGLVGPLPPNFNQLTELVNLGLQRNKFTGPLPSFSGLSKLQYAYLGTNQFDSIPADFFEGLTSLLEFSLEDIPLNDTDGWTLPSSLSSAAQLQKLFLSGCNLAGPIPDFLGSMASLSILELAYNRLSGPIPSTFNGSQLETFWLNNQNGQGLSGPIDVFATMSSLEQLWIHGNQFSGTIPAALAICVSLQDLKLNDNKLVGPIPPELASMPALRTLSVGNNMLTGPIPKLKTGNFSYNGNYFCQSEPGTPCAPDVAALLDFLGGVLYPENLATKWAGNDPCSGEWLGVSCNPGSKNVSVLNLQNYHLNGTISPSITNLSSLKYVLLARNNLGGVIPPGLAQLPSLLKLDVSSNNFQPPIPSFSNKVLVLTDGNPRLDKNSTGGGDGALPPTSGSSPPSSGGSPPSTGGSTPSSHGSQRNPAGGAGNSITSGWKSKKIVAIVAPVVAVAGLLVFLVPSVVFCVMKKKKDQTPSSFVVYPRSQLDPDNVVKIVVANNSEAARSAMSVSGTQNKGILGEAQVIEAGNLLISVQVLRGVTRNFSPENELGRGGFGVVYKGVLDDGTMIAVKRMEAAVVSNKALDEFQSEIAVLSKVRHRHLVSLLGYCIEGNERLLVYEYMPQGALSKHIFQWQKLNLQPLSWKRRLNVALDVARGIEYLHSLAHQSFIHRDLKSSNILLGDDFRAKVADFGLVKLAPDEKGSVATRLAGTFGYLAPEYAVTGKVTTKADVFSFGVVLMELVTGLMALDEDRSEESRYLVSWFWQIKTSREALLAAIDPALDVTEETIESICIVAELARHCTSREPNQRPDMSHAVNVLSPLVEKWKPTDEDEDEFEGITYDKSLLQMVKVWQASDGGAENSLTASDDSKGSIPARPAGFAESFTSADGR
ncbi:receptor protein kinase TMK1-like [Nymphaea colorata]|nr:receptor protein kinase TMK1-like [Nymphaea colorata]